MSSDTALRLAVVISGGGSNMLAIARACASGMINARIVSVIADRPEAGGIEAARQLGLPVAVLVAREYHDRAGFEHALRAAIDASAAQLVVLAGFMRILSPEFAAHYAGRMLNIHPSLLPRYPGLHTHERVLAAGDSSHGCSVHVVTGVLDGGPLILQARVPVLPGDTPATLSARVQLQEHIIYPEVIGWIAAGRLAITGATPQFDGRPLNAPMIRECTDHECS
jgi:phosphoribosylglycinamide formyltransferase-1